MFSLRNARRCHHWWWYPRRPSAYTRVLMFSSRCSQTSFRVGNVHDNHVPLDNWFRFFTTTVTSDAYERYRHLSQDVVDLIQHENSRTREYIHSNLKTEIEQEILQAYASATETACPEIGPTGQYLYSVEEDVANGQRQYRRRHVTFNEEQHVWDIDFHKHQLVAMSLSVEETLVACLVSPVAAPSRTLVQIGTLHSNKGNRRSKSCCP